MDKYIPDCMAHYFVCDIIRQGKWDLTKIQHLLSSYICDMIKAIPLSINYDTKDFIRWFPSKDEASPLKSFIIII